MTLTIRPFQLDDVDALYAAARESIAEVGAWLPWCHPGYDRSDAELWLARCAECFERGLEYSFALVDGDVGILGGCGLNQIVPAHRMANLGYWVRSSARGRGLAPRAVRLLAEFAFRETELTRLEIVCAVANVASQRVAQKAGARREGVLRDRIFLHGASHDAVMFALLRRDARPELPT